MYRLQIHALDRSFSYRLGQSYRSIQRFRLGSWLYLLEGSRDRTWIYVGWNTKCFQVSTSLTGPWLVLISNYKRDPLTHGNEIMSSENNSCRSLRGSPRQHLRSHDSLRFALVSFQEGISNELLFLQNRRSIRAGRMKIAFLKTESISRNKRTTFFED